MNDSQIKKELIELQAKREQLQKKQGSMTSNKVISVFIPFLGMFSAVAFFASFGVHALIAITLGIIVFIVLIFNISSNEAAMSANENGLVNLDQQINKLLDDLNKANSSRSIQNTPTPTPKSTSIRPVQQDLDGEEPIHHSPKLTFTLILIDAIFKKYKRITPKPYSLQLKAFKQKLLVAEINTYISQSAIADLIDTAVDIRNDIDPFGDEWLWEKLQLVVDLLIETSNRDHMMSAAAIEIINGLNT